MITLYQFPEAFGLPSLSPFCTKVEAYLRLSGLEYRLERGDPRRAPKGKLPYIDDAGTVVADSGFIVEHLKLTRGRDCDASLDPRQRATGHAVRRMIEESLYWVMLYARWIDEQGWRAYEPALASILPTALRAVMPAGLRRGVRKSLKRQGIGRHSAAEIYAIGVSDLDAVADLLEDRPYVLGADPTSFDATVYAFLWHVASFPVDSPLTRTVQRREPLAAYLRRVGERLGW